MEDSNRNLEEILTDRFTAQDNFIEKQQEILKDYNKTLLQLNEIIVAQSIKGKRFFFFIFLLFAVL